MHVCVLECVALKVCDAALRCCIVVQDGAEGAGLVPVVAQVFSNPFERFLARRVDPKPLGDHTTKKVKTEPAAGGAGGGAPQSDSVPSIVERRRVHQAGGYAETDWQRKRWWEVVGAAPLSLFPQLRRRHIAVGDTTVAAGTDDLGSWGWTVEERRRCDEVLTTPTWQLLWSLGGSTPSSRS